ncbi:MAG: YybH family protein [Steroidobacteraceae bacterium]
MKTVSLYVLRAVIFITLIGCPALPARADSVRSAIESANVEFSVAAQKGDSAALAALYAADGQVMPAGSDAIRGKQAIQKFWQGALDSGIAGIALKTVEVFAQGAAATEVGQYELRDKAGKVLDHGKYIVIWRHEGDKWKLLRDMFSTNVAPSQK